MWPFRRKAEAPAPDGPQPVPAPVIRRDWAGLPPIQRFVGAHPLTAPSDEFSDDLATHQDPSVTTDTMGHQVSADAPPGLVLALARPTTRSDGPAMIPRPRVQRTVAGAVAESGEWDGDEAAPDLARPSPLPMSGHAVAPRELAVVAPEPAIQRLTSLPPDAAPTPIAPMAQRSRAVPTPSSTSHASDEPTVMLPAPAPRLTLGQSRRLGLGAPIRQVPDHTVQRVQDPTLPQRGSEFEPLETTKETRAAMELPTVQRARIDVASVEASPELQPLISEPRMSVPSVTRAPSHEARDESRLDLTLARPPVPDEAFAGSRPLIPPTAQLSAVSSTEAASDSPPTAPSTVQRLAHSSPSARSSTTNLTPNTPPATAMAAVSSVRLPLVAESSVRVPTVSATSALDTPMAPLVGTRSLRPSSALQRSASADAPVMTLPQMETEDAATLTLPQAGRENRVSFLQRKSENPPTPSLINQGGRVTTQSILQRASEDTPRPDPPPQGGREFPLTRASEGAPTLTLPQRGRENQATILQRTEEGRLPLAPTRAVAVQASTDDTLHPDPPRQDGRETLQGVWYESRVGDSRFPEGGTTSDSMAPVAAPAGPHQASETEMDELARKLYDRIRTRLRTELLVDRERAGFLTDLR